MQAMTFSIATPARNALPALKHCVGSVRRQTGVTVEHLVQDAASTDGTGEWLRTQPALKWTSEPDNGMYDAVDKAWKRSEGEVLSWLNADEQYLPGTLATVAEVFQQHPAIDAVFGDYIVCDALTGKPAAARREIPLRRFYLQRGPLYALSCTLFFRRSLFERGLLHFNPDLRAVADADLVIRLMDAGVRFLHIPRYLGLFGVGAANLSMSSTGRDETALLHHACGTGGPLVNLLARSMRVAEKAIAGSYRREHLEYEFCTDEQGNVKNIVADNVPPRWRWRSPE